MNAPSFAERREATSKARGRPPSSAKDVVMLFLVVLVMCYLATWLLPRGRQSAAADRWRYAMAGAMVIAGAAHLLNPTPFIQHLPTWVPGRGTIVFVSGIVEIGLGAALVAPTPWRRWAGWALAAYLVAVFPANAYVAVAGIEVDGQPGGPYPWVRLPFQALFVWLAVWSTRLPTPEPTSQLTPTDR